MFKLIFLALISDNETEEVLQPVELADFSVLTPYF